MPRSKHNKFGFNCSESRVTTTCGECGYTSKSKTALKLHQKYSHPNNTFSPADNLDHICTTCGETFDNLHKFKSHVIKTGHKYNQK